MKFLMLIKHSESYRSQPIPQGLMDAMGKFVEQGFKSGVLKDTAGLKPTAEGHRIRSSGGKLHATDGPFTEAKELIAGYTLIQVKSREEAMEWARRFPNPSLGDGEIEVRQVFELEDFGASPAIERFREMEARTRK